MSDSHSLSGNTGHDATPPSQHNPAADQFRFDSEALDGFLSENCEDVDRAGGQPRARPATNTRSLFAFDADETVDQIRVFPETPQAYRDRGRSVPAVIESARRRGSLGVAGISLLGVRVARRIGSTASRLAAQLSPGARFLAATTRHLAIAVGSGYRRIGRVPRRRPIAATAMLSLVVVVAAFDRLTDMSPGFVTKPFASGALSSDTIEPVVVTPVAVNAVTPFERFRSAIPPMTPSVTPASRPRRAAPANDTRAIQSVLNRYRDALSILDVAAVRAVWPSVDVAAVRSGFARVVEQNVEFEACRISSVGMQATASCAGVLESGLNPRQRRPRSERKRWQFTLHKTGDRWRITNVSSAALTGQTVGRATGGR